MVSTALNANYSQSSVTVQKCPDLRQPPFGLAFQGLSGNEVIADIGGQEHLFPTPLLNKRYSLLECAKLMQMSPDKGALLGAGANYVDTCIELAPNVSWQGDKVTYKTRGTSVVENGVTCPLYENANCALMMNLYGSNGDGGPVLKVTARDRTGDCGSFTELIRLSISGAFGERQISLGGVFLVKAGKALFHVMPNLPPKEDLPFKDRRAVEQWLTFHEFPAPMVCLSVFHSADPEQLGLRLEHTHCFSLDRDEGGHYHHDVGDEVEYEGYFNVAKQLIRIDMPRKL